MNVPAGQDGDVAEHGLAAVAEAGGLDRADVEQAAELVDDQHRQGFALDVLGDDEQRLAGLGDLLQQRQHVADVGELLLVDAGSGRSPYSALHVRRVGRRSTARCSPCRTACPRRTRASVSEVLPSSTVMTPSLPTFSKASAISLPIFGSLLARDAGDLLHLFLLGQPLGELASRCSTASATALSMPRLTAIGLAPAVMFRSPSW